MNNNGIAKDHKSPETLDFDTTTMLAHFQNPQSEVRKTGTPPPPYVKAHSSDLADYVDHDRTSRFLLFFVHCARKSFLGTMH